MRRSLQAGHAAFIPMSTTSPSRTVKVILVEDHAMFRERLGQLLAKNEAFEISGEADNIQSAMQIIQRVNPDIVIADISLRGSSGLELIKDLKAQGMNVPVLVLSMHEEALYAERALRAGAKGYITKHQASATLAKAIHTVLDGNIYLSDEMTSAALAKVSGQNQEDNLGGVGSLTDRELEVFQLVGKGRTTSEISNELNLGVTTVDTYRARIKEKLGLRNAAALNNRASQWVHESGI